MKPIQIELDYKFNTHPIIEMVQGTVAPFEIAIFDNYEEEKLSSATITINMLKADETFIALTSGINKVNNIINFISPKDFTRESGKGKIQVIIKDSNFEVYTWEIDVDIIPAVINEDIVPSENIIPIIEEIQSKINETLELKNTLDQWIKENSEIFNINDKVLANEKNISTLKIANDTNKTDISSIFSKIVTNINDINQNKSDIEENSNQIQALKEINAKFSCNTEEWLLKAEIPFGNKTLVIESNKLSVPQNGSTITVGSMSSIFAVHPTAYATNPWAVGVTISGKTFTVKHSYNGSLNMLFLIIGLK